MVSVLVEPAADTTARLFFLDLLMALWMADWMGPATAVYIETGNASAEYYLEKIGNFRTGRDNVATRQALDSLSNTLIEVLLGRGDLGDFFDWTGRG